MRRVDVIALHGKLAANRVETDPWVHPARGANLGKDQAQCRRGNVYRGRTSRINGADADQVVPDASTVIYANTRLVVGCSVDLQVAKRKGTGSRIGDINTCANRCGNHRVVKNIDGTRHLVQENPVQAVLRNNRPEIHRGVHIVQYQRRPATGVDKAERVRDIHVTRILQVHPVAADAEDLKKTKDRVPDNRVHNDPRARVIIPKHIPEINVCIGDIGKIQQDAVRRLKRVGNIRLDGEVIDAVDIHPSSSHIDNQGGDREIGPRRGPGDQAIRSTAGDRHPGKVEVDPG